LISPTIGLGPVATRFIPKGTIAWVLDKFDIIMTPDEFEALPKPYAEIADRYAYIDPTGHAILCWDHARYMNHHCEPAVRGFQYAGADFARIPDEVLDALHAANLEAVVIGPGNPYHAIRPMLEIDGMKRLLRRRGVPVVAVTPIVGGRALRGSAGKMMRELGRELSARSVAGEYLRIIDGFVLDSEDAALAESVRSLGMAVVALPTIMRSVDDRVVLAQEVLDFATSIRERREAEVE
jgi:LPPG:FO 2-phospho-L-lactate transferase